MEYVPDAYPKPDNIGSPEWEDEWDDADYEPEYEDEDNIRICMECGATEEVEICECPAGPRYC